MKIINEENLEGKHWQFSCGEAINKRIIETPDIMVSVSTIAPNSKVPDRPHKHERHEMLYVKRGNVKISVGQETKEVKNGDFIVFEPYEEHYLTTGEDELVLLEVFWK